jgi:hypothetical protein
MLLECMLEKCGNAAHGYCGDATELDNSMPCRKEEQLIWKYRKAKTDRMQIWEDYWLTRGIAPSSLSTWRLNEFSWDMEKLPEDLRKLYEEDMLKDGSDLVMLSA